MARLLQRVTVLHPYRGISRVPVERLAIMPHRQLPLPRVPGAIGERD